MTDSVVPYLNKAEIVRVGQCTPSASVVDENLWAVTNWVIDCQYSDYPGMSMPAGVLGGWTPAELALIADLAEFMPEPELLARVNRYRKVVPRTLG